jgi:GNAT superfamily N-acetyltransferase
LFILAAFNAILGIYPISTAHFLPLAIKQYLLFLPKLGNHMIAVTIRRATVDDCPRMLELIRELALYEKAPNEVSVSLAHFIESGFGPRPVYWAFVAELDNSIVAFALYYIRYSTWKGQRMYLEDILVTEEHRGKGIGAKLMEALVVEAKERKLQGIHWQVLDWNEPAINFYRKYNTKFDGEWLNASLSEF